MSFLRLNELVEDIYRYLDVRFELFKLDTEERLVRLNILIVELVISLAIVCIFILFMFLGLAFYLNSIWQSSYLGFFATAGLQIGLLGIGLIIRRLFPNFFRALVRKNINQILYHKNTQKGKD